MGEREMSDEIVKKILLEHNKMIKKLIELCAKNDRRISELIIRQKLEDLK